MNIKVTNQREDVTVTIKKDPNGNVEVLVQPKNTRTLGSCKVGETVKLGNREYIVLEHSKDTTAVITKKFAKEMKFGNIADWETSDIRKYCNSEFFNELSNAVGRANIIEHTVKLMCDDGSNKGASVKDKVSILTTDLYRRYRELLPAYGEWWHTATKVTAMDKDYSRDVCYVKSNGVLGWDSCGFAGGVRPFCILNSSILIP